MQQSLLSFSECRCCDSVLACRLGVVGLIGSGGGDSLTVGIVIFIGVGGCAVVTPAAVTFKGKVFKCMHVLILNVEPQIYFITDNCNIGLS